MEPAAFEKVPENILTQILDKNGASKGGQRK
jgi:hypothetical protein